MRKINIVDPINPIFDPDKINIWNFVFAKNPQLIKSMDSHSLSQSTRIYARECKFGSLDKTTAIGFLNQNHIKGAYNHQHGFGLFYDGELVAVMTFGRSRYNENFDWEIIRYACLQTFTVVGGASKLLSGAIKALGSNSIFSYSENMIGVGNLYEKLGFEFLGETGPGFFWYKPDQIINRQMAARYNLSKMFPDDVDEIYSTPISTFMKSKGFIQVFDMGNKRWGMNPKQKVQCQENHSSDFVFVEHNGEVITVSEMDAGQYKKVNLRKLVCNEMVKDGEVRLIPQNLITDFQQDGWEKNTKIPGNTGMIKIKKGDETKFIRLEELEKFENEGWTKTNRNNAVKKYTRAPATSGKIAVKKDGVKKMVLPDEAYSMVKYQGWELCAASCWRLASDEVKKLGRELGYDV